MAFCTAVEEDELAGAAGGDTDRFHETLTIVFPVTRDVSVDVFTPEAKGTVISIGATVLNWGNSIPAMVADKTVVSGDKLSHLANVLIPRVCARDQRRGRQDCGCGHLGGG